MVRQKSKDLAPPVTAGGQCRQEPSEAVRCGPPESNPSWSTPAPGVRGAVDALVQGAFVELFHAYGVALAPTPRASLRGTVTFSDITATIGFVRDAAGYSKQHGRLTLSMPSGAFELVKNDEIRAARPDDWARELVNQLMGRIKHRLLQFGASLQIGLPSSVSPHSGERAEASPTLLVYTGRTLRGDVLLTLDGMPNDSELSYVGPEVQALEGDLILF